jgi:hypothetical protein
LADLAVAETPAGSESVVEKTDWDFPAGGLPAGGFKIPNIVAEPSIDRLLENAGRADLIATIKALRTAVLSLDRRLKHLEAAG